LTEKGAKSLKRRVVIIGNGIAGNSAASAIRQFDKDVNITMISNESSPLYSPCAFYKYLSGEMGKQKLFLKTFDDYQKDRIETVFGQKVSKVDTQAREVLVGDRRIYFDKLILATGSTAVSLPIKGADKREAFLLKTMGDIENIFNYPTKKVAVIGSGPIGMEAAIALREKGLEVSVIEILTRILPRLFDDEPATMLREIVQDHGINVFTDERVTEILGNGAVKGLTTNKRQIECDTVIMAAGVKPNTELAKQMGVDIGNLGGIRTDGYMMTNVEGIYACGDCIESKDIITGERTLSLLWHNAKRQGWVSGCNCIGKRSRFIGSFDAITIEVFGNYASSVGRSAACFTSPSDYDVAEKRADSYYHRLITANDRLVGIQLINKIEHAGSLFSKMLRKDNLVELKKVVLDDKLLSMKPWHHWIRQYIT
jgi:NADH oxidase (H2O2-forming)